jgi:competence protein ComEC
VVAVVGHRPGLAASVGLHLSAAATAGIVLWARPLAQRLRALPRPVALGLGATLAAQVAVAPLLVGTFGELSVAGPVTNLLALPAVPVATVAGLTAAVAGALYEPLGALVARGAEPFVGWILWVGSSFGRADWAALRPAAWLGWAAGVPVGAAAVLSVIHRGAPD